MFSFNLFSKNSKNVKTYNDLKTFLPKYTKSRYWYNRDEKLYAVLFPDNKDAKDGLTKDDFDNLSKLPKNIDTYTTDEIKSFDDLHKLTQSDKLQPLVIDPLKTMTYSPKHEEELKTHSQLFFEDVQENLLKKPEIGIIDKLKKKYARTEAEKKIKSEEIEAGAGTNVQNYIGGRKSHRRNKKTRKLRKQKKSRRANKK